MKLHKTGIRNERFDRKYCPRIDIIYREEPTGCSQLDFGLRKAD